MIQEILDKSRAYRFESAPLEIALDPEVGDFIYTTVGDCFKCVSDYAGQLRFELVHPTVIGDGSLLPDLSDKQLELFWALSRTELKRVKDGIKNTSERGE